MKTSYFGNLKDLKGEKVISIARGNPKWYFGETFIELAPTWNMIKNMSEEEYIEAYNRKLDKLDAGFIYNILGENSILLCWERPDDFCHRRLVAKWFENELGIVVPEFGIEKKQENEAKKRLRENQLTIL